MSLDDQIDRDLHLCDHVHIDGNVTSKYHQLLQNYSRILQDFIPQTFLPQFKNPCWYSHYPHTKNDKCRDLPQRIELLKHSNRTKDNVSLYCLPAFFLAGFSKCATTTLFHMIKQHPDIAPPTCKEGEFWPVFIERDGNRESKVKEIVWYLSHFSSPTKIIQSRPQAITLDASTHTLPGYISKKISDSEIGLAPSMIKHVLPNAKFIVTMRDPTKRLFSQYWFHCHKSHAWKTKRDPVHYYSVIAQRMFHNITAYAINLFQLCIEKGYSRFECVRRVTAVKYVNSCATLQLGDGMYYYHIVSWLDVFPRENFLFLTTEELVSSPDTEMSKVWAFLGLHHLSKIEHRYSNANKWIIDSKYKSNYTMLPETKQMLDKFYQPHNELLAHLLSDSKYMWN